MEDRRWKMASGGRDEMWVIFRCATSSPMNRLPALREKGLLLPIPLLPSPPEEEREKTAVVASMGAKRERRFGSSLPYLLLQRRRGSDVQPWTDSIMRRREHAKAWAPRGIVRSLYFGENVLATGVYAGRFFGS